jgi:tight adherence protein B
MTGTPILVLGALAVFAALVLIGFQLAQPRVRRRRLAAELGAAPHASANRLSSLGNHATVLAGRALDRYDQEGRLGRALERAGIDMRPAEFAAMTGVVFAAVILLALALFGIIVAAAAGVIVIVAVRGTVTARGRKRRAAFEGQLGDTLQLMASGLRAGHSMPQVIDSLAREADSPTAEEFQRVLFETRLGHSFPRALRSLAERMGSEDFEWVVEAIEIQREVGGDLAELLDNVMRTIRDRTRVRQHITTLTAEGRLSAGILFCLPIVMFGYMQWMNPSYIGELTSTGTGLAVLVTGGVLMIVGGLWLRRIIRLEF